MTGGSKEYRVNTPLFMSYAAKTARERERCAPNASRVERRSRIGWKANRALRSKKYSGSWYYPEIAPISPRFVGITFCTSHTMMEVQKRGGLIASSEARIVESRQASNRLSCETQSAARRRIGRPQTNR